MRKLLPAFLFNPDSYFSASKGKSRFTIQSYSPSMKKNAERSQSLTPQLISKASEDRFPTYTYYTAESGSLFRDCLPKVTETD